MDPESWWPKLSSAEQQWLIDHNGEALTSESLAAITRAGGSPDQGALRAELAPGSSDFFLPDETIDWVEAVANGETPGTRQ